MLKMIKIEKCNDCPHCVYYYPEDTPYCRRADMRVIPYRRPANLSPMELGMSGIFDVCAKTPKPIPEWCPLEEK